MSNRIEEKEIKETARKLVRLINSAPSSLLDEFGEKSAVTSRKVAKEIYRIFLQGEELF